jgi:transcriptional regulator with XRE-family HTH domain
MTEPNDDCFDGRAFFTCVDEQRRERGLSWAALGRVTHVSPPTIRRFATGEVIEADGVFALVRWLGRPLEDFSPANRHLSSGKPPAPARPGTMLRRDTARLYAGLMERVEKDGVTLDQISQETGASIAQLKGFEKGGRTDIRIPEGAQVSGCRLPRLYPYSRLQHLSCFGKIDSQR